MPGWLEVFANEGAAREVAGNHPLVLDDADAVWMVRSGWLDVFGVPPPRTKVPSARVRLCRVEAGQALFGVGLGKGSLLAVGDPATQVARLGRARVGELAQQPDLSGPFANLVDAWARGLTTGVLRRRPPRRAMLLEPGREATLGQKAAVTPAQGTLWVRHVQGSSWFLGKAELPITKDVELFPLASPGWLAVAEADTRLAGATTETVLGQGTIWPALERFHQVIMASMASNAVEREVTELGRLVRRTEAEKERLRATVERFVRVTALREGDHDAFGDDRGPVVEEGPLLGACRLVGARLGVTIQPPLDAGETRKRSDPISAIARASRVRMRPVRLAGKWWREDHGPLLAFLAADERPVALLPTSPTSYEMVDPQTLQRTAVTAASADLSPSAYSFYRPFPSRPLTPWGLFRFGVKGSWRDWLSILVLSLAGSLLGMVTPLFIGWVFDSVIPDAARHQLVLVVAALVVCAAAAALFQLTRGIAMLRLEATMDGAVQAGIWDRLLNLPATFFRRYTTGDLAMRALGIVAIRQVLTDVALSVLLSFVFSLVYFVLLFYYEVRLAWLAALIYASALAVTGLAAWRQLHYQRRIHQVRGRNAGLVLQLITGITRLRLAGAEERALAVWGRDFSLQKRLAFLARSAANNLATFNAALPVVGAILLFAMVASQPVEAISLGGFLAFSAAFMQVLWSAIQMGSVLSYFIQVVPLYERARPILEALPEADAASAIPGDLSGDVELSHVSFRYQADSPLVLNDVSVTIRAGEFVAFVGPSGAGKSTLIRLLVGFEKPISGSVYYDRTDLAVLDCQAVRRQIGVVLQDGKLIPGDLFSNIIGASLLTLEDAWEAARLAGLDDDIAEMPMGMQTVISEGASTLSGGQRQRLMIARAVVAKPRILLFDEATSALDNETQAQVSRSLERLKATRVVIAHRLSTIQSADRIYVLDAGRIVQSGRYEELMQQQGLLRDMAQRQLV
ncbi:MAG TPA: NHLP bacteriocin export ABC transporter permease/ATPase subunit [Gemmataceae bacterium]|jgi:NHLM bacteriocin system ABC transporter ATP-binding protein|nr:NHLP bacteriocin export ABC transporter permease/ATPase subunit [Gemmataceae bacterium]